MNWSIVQADAIDFLRAQPADSIDLVFGSPPYEEARLYLENGKDMGISRKTDDWVKWMVEVYRAATVACKGLVAFVVGHGQTKNYRWSGAPALLCADMIRAGFNLRDPKWFHRVGIPGSGGPDDLRKDLEWIVCTSRPGKLPWSDNTACGKPPKWAPGGEMSHRLSDGTRTNQWGKNGSPRGMGNKNADGSIDSSARPSHKTRTKSGVRHKTFHQPNGEQENQSYAPPAIANPGNVLECTVGGGQMGGDVFASQNEAPFPEKLAEFFILSFCPPGGTVADCFSGSGTVAAVAKRNGRNFVGCDLRQSQVDLGNKRLAAETPSLFSEAP